MAAIAIILITNVLPFNSIYYFIKYPLAEIYYFFVVQTTELTLH